MQRIREVMNMGKMIVLTFSDSEETVFKRAVSLLADELQIEVEQQPVSPSVLSFQGLEIRQHQHRVLRDRRDVRLTRLEYGTLIFLASSPNRVFTQSHIFEAVWSMESNSCHSSVTNVIYNLRKKIEPDSKNPTYLKTVSGIGYKFSPDSAG